LNRHRGLLLLLLAVLVLDLIGLGWGLPHTTAPQVDDLAKPALNALQSFFLGETKYPKVHLLTLGVAYSPYLSWLWMTGGLDLGGAALGTADSSVLRDPPRALTVIILIARGVSVLMHLGCVVLLFAAARRLVRHRAAALAAAALFGFSPVVALFARSSHVDIPMMFWFGAALLQYLRVLENPTRRRLVGYALIAILGVCTKDQIALALLPISLHIAFRVLVRRTPRAVGDLGIAAGLGLLLYALLSELFWSPALWARRLAWWQGDLARHEAEVAARTGPLELARDAVVAYAELGSPAMAVLTLLALFSLAWSPTRRGLALFLYMLIYPLLLFGYLGFVETRYMMPAVFVGCLLIAGQWDAIRSRARRISTLLVAFILLFNAVHGAQVAHALLGEPRALAYAWLEQHVPAGSTVETYQNENHLPGLRAAGLTPFLTRDMTPEGMSGRNPDVVVVADDEYWRWSPEERAFVDWLFSGPPGYRVQRFGPDAGGRLPLLLDITSVTRFWPNVAILIRIET
jgi:hypothetical protein